MIINAELLAKDIFYEQARSFFTGYYEAGKPILVRRYIKDKSFPRILDMLLNGPCEVEFNRVYSKSGRSGGGARVMRCFKENMYPINAFNGNYPTLIAVIELHGGGHKSFYYGQMYKITRLLEEELSTEERHTIFERKGEDYDFNIPGIEGRSIKGHEMREQPDYLAERQRDREKKKILRARGDEDITIVVPDNPYLRNS